MQQIIEKKQRRPASRLATVMFFGHPYMLAYCTFSAVHYLCISVMYFKDRKFY